MQPSFTKPLASLVFVQFNFVVLNIPAAFGSGSRYSAGFGVAPNKRHRSGGEVYAVVN